MEWLALTEKMFTVPILSLAALCSLFCTTEAAITGWTTPSIATPNGSGAVTAPIPENLVAGTTTGITIAATGGTGVMYTIGSQPTEGKLTIVSTGLLTLAVGTFDYETSKTYVLTVIATEGTTVAGTATVTLSISDVNEAPVFASTQYAATIPDGSTAGTTLTTVAASDLDEGDEDEVTYGLDTASNVNGVFAIGANTGIITVAASKTTDAATVGGYKLLVTAADSAPLTATATVWVAVKTCSSNSAALIISGVTMLVALVASLQ